MVDLFEYKMMHGLTNPEFIGIHMCGAKYYEEYMAQHTTGYAGVPDGIMNPTAYTRSQTLWRTSKLED